MTALRLRWVRVAVVVAIALGILGSLGWSRSVDGYDGVLYGFRDVELGETVFAAVADTRDTLSVRRVWVDTAGPIEVEAVRCPDALLGSALTCAGGPVPAVGTPMGGSPRDEATASPMPDPTGPDLTGDNILVLAVTRTGPGPAAVCGTRVLYTAGWQAGLVRSLAQIELPTIDEQLPESDEPGIAAMLCD